MATIFFTSIGFAIGNFVGFQSVGSFLGGEIGSFISQKLFNKENEKIINSSRLDDLLIQTSSYGRLIPICFGNMRIAGNIIWSMPLKEVLSTEIIESDGGGFLKGLLSGSYSNNSKIQNKTYNYYANIAIGICEGEVDSLIHIWADNILLDLNNIEYRFYNGSETQGQDRLISSVEGPENTPAFRGLCYIVIENFHINPFSNRIPNFTFEIKRNLKNQDSLTKKIDAINIIPGSGEFVYDTKLIFKKQIDYFDINGSENFEIIDGTREVINNSSNDSKKSDSVLALDQMGEEFSSIKWINIVVSWFVSGLDLKNIELYPAVEFNDILNEDQIGNIEEWRVAGLNRKKAKLIKRDPNNPNKPNYGGTPSDNSLRRYIAELKKRGYNVILYPMILVDKENKPWRGFISGLDSEIEDFFKNNKLNQNTFSYFDFIMHYAKNFSDIIDGIIIGSELKSITKISSDIKFLDENGNEKDSKEFKAVKFLSELASKVRAEGFMGSREKKILYAADWSEYHHEDNGYFHMDELFANDDIDFVGIDAYFPLTDSENLTYIPSKNEIKKGFESGEGFEYYYEYDNNGNRKKVFFNDQRYAWKDVIHWWDSEHTNPDGRKTKWKPRMKKICFTEFGFPSIHGASNSPNIFFNPDSSSGGIPVNSNGSINFDLQALCIEASIEYWKEKNLEYDILWNMFLWCFDSRPYPYFPLNKNKWSDYNLWEAGHWINGKLDRVNIKDIIFDLIKRSDFWFFKNKDIKNLFFSDLGIGIDGFVISNSSMTLLDAIYILKNIYPFSILEDDKIKFLLKSNNDIKVLLDKRDDILYQEINNKPVYDEFHNVENIFKINHIKSVENIVSSVSISYISKEYGFQPRNIIYSLDDI